MAQRSEQQQLPQAINSFGNALLSKVTPQVGSPVWLRTWPSPRAGALLPPTDAATVHRPQGAGEAPAGTGAFVSPYGLAEALGMLSYAASPGSASAQQLEQVVFGGASCGDAALGASLSALRGALTAASDDSDGLTVSVGSSSWLAPRFTLQPEFAATLESAFGAEAKIITDAAAVNSWVAAATKGKINSIVDDAAVSDPAAALILVNAVFFKGLWASQFKK